MNKDKLAFTPIGKKKITIDKKIVRMTDAEIYEAESREIEDIKKNNQLKQTYLQKLKHPKWQEKRLRVFERDLFSCKLCGDTETCLHVHHLKYTKDLPYEEPNENLITYCENCHSIVEAYKKVNPMLNVVRIIKHKAYIGLNACFIQSNADNITLAIIYQDGKIDFLLSLHGNVVRDFNSLFKVDFELIKDIYKK